MVLWALLIAAVLLSIERLTYLWIWHFPAHFQTFCNRPPVAVFGEPVEVLQKLFYFFKLLQLAVFLGWCIIFSEGGLPLPTGGPVSIMAGGLLIISGQFLNFSVFFRLGTPGVFYGNKFGYEIPWCSGFPFSVFRHPQYAGALISIWGFFLIMRFPHDDWMLLPILETCLYVVGAYYER